MDYSQNVKFMQVPVVGSGEFVREWVEYKMAIIKRVFAGLRGLSKRQVALYLLRRAGHGCRFYITCALPLGTLFHSLCNVSMRK